MMRAKRNNGSERIQTIQKFRRKYGRDRNFDIRRLLSGTLIVALLLGQMELSDIFAQTGAVMQIAAFRGNQQSDCIRWDAPRRVVAS